MKVNTSTEGLSHEAAAWLAGTLDTEEKRRLLLRLADIFKVLGEPTRLKILRVLWQGECCVNELADAIDMEASAVSHQLRILRQAHLVDFRKIGKNACYFLDDAHVVHLLEQGLNHAAHRGEE